MRISAPLASPRWDAFNISSNRQRAYRGLLEKRFYGRKFNVSSILCHGIGRAARGAETAGVDQVHPSEKTCGDSGGISVARPDRVDRLNVRRGDVAPPAPIINP